LFSLGMLDRTQKPQLSFSAIVSRRYFYTG
jgi:hypothetical protein